MNETPKEFKWLNNAITLVAIVTPPSPQSNETFSEKYIPPIKEVFNNNNPDSAKPHQPRYFDIKGRPVDESDIISLTEFLKTRKIDYINGKKILELGEQNYDDLNPSLATLVKRIQTTQQNIDIEKKVIFYNLPQAMGMILLEHIQRVRDLNFCISIKNPQMLSKFKLTQTDAAYFIRGDFSHEEAEILKKSLFDQKENMTFINTQNGMTLIIKITDKIDELLDKLVENFPYSQPSTNKNSPTNN